MATQKRLLLTGGGSSGHVTPNLAIISAFQAKGWDLAYIGSARGIEKEIIGKTEIPYYPIATGKLRRYFSWQNFIDPFKIAWGAVQACYYCWRLKPSVVFSKGGFVSFPVVFAAWLNRIPVIAHESDYSPGLATRLSVPFAKTICVTFDDAIRFFKDKTKVTVTGTPLRQNLLDGNADKGRAFCGFDTDKKTILIYGGGLGARSINEAIRAQLPDLLASYNLIHLCGKGKADKRVQQAGYCQLEYVHDEMGDLLACADMVISRAGANSIYELIALKKPHILIPLSSQASRGDQLQNAAYFSKLGLSSVLQESELTPKSLADSIAQLADSIATYQAKLDAYDLPNSVERIQKLIEESAV